MLLLLYVQAELGAGLLWISTGASSRPSCRPICPRASSTQQLRRFSPHIERHQQRVRVYALYALRLCDRGAGSNMAGTHAHCHVRAKAADRTRHRVNTPFGLLGRHLTITWYQQTYAGEAVA